MWGSKCIKKEREDGAREDQQRIQQGEGKQNAIGEKFPKRAISKEIHRNLIELRKRVKS
jgi:hypothetical protein